MVRAAHLGDWGTQFGMLIEHVLDVGEEPARKQLAAGEFTPFYQAARSEFDTSPEFADRARRRVPLLQSGDPESRRLWQVLVAGSMDYLMAIYRRLDIKLTEATMAPESFYNSIKFWKTPIADCGNGKKDCTDLRAWTTAWQQVKG